MVAHRNPQGMLPSCRLLPATLILRTAKSPGRAAADTTAPGTRVNSSDTDDRRRFRNSRRHSERTLEQGRSRLPCALCMPLPPTFGEGRDSCDARQHEDRIHGQGWNGSHQPNPGSGTPENPVQTGGSRELTRHILNGHSCECGHRPDEQPQGVVRGELIHPSFQRQ